METTDVVSKQSPHVVIPVFCFILTVLLQWSLCSVPSSKSNANIDVANSLAVASIYPSLTPPDMFFLVGKELTSAHQELTSGKRDPED